MVYVSNIWSAFLGADIPGITEDIIDTAFKLLRNRGTDMVLGKAEDGGYYLIGLHKSSKTFLGILYFVVTFYDFF